MRHYSFLGPAALVIFLAIAATAEEPSRIFAYSQRETPAASWMQVAFDGENAAEVKRGFYFALNVRPGRHSLSLADGVPVSLEVHPGAELFVRLDWSHDISRSPIPVLNAVTEERAKREMRFLSYVGAKRIQSGAVLRLDPRPPQRPQLRTKELR